MLRIAIVEDDERDARTLAEYCRKAAHELGDHVDTKIYSDPVVFLEKYRADCDIVFMDIYVGDELGIDVAGKLRNEGYDNLLIFSTITPEYAIASYSVKANGYILKPFSGERIESVLDRVL